MQGPYPIVERRGKSVLLLNLGKDASGNDRHKIHHWANCQPARLAPDTKSAVAPQRGRPKGATSRKPPRTTTGGETPVDSPTNNGTEGTGRQPIQTTTKYGRASKPPKRLGCDI